MWGRGLDLDKAFLGLIFAVFLGVTLMLMPLTLLHTGIKKPGEIKPETPGGADLVNKNWSAETLDVQKAPIGGVDWFSLASILILGLIPAVAIYIVIKRKMGPKIKLIAKGVNRIE